jgi:hypothetical protein
VKRLSDQTLYEIIEVSVEAAPEEIARACDRAAATYGPGSLVTYTLASSEESALLSSRIEEARAVLLDPSARSRYDERIGVRPPAAPPATPVPVVAPEPAPEPRPDPVAAPTTWPAPLVEPVAVEPLHVSPGLPVVAAPLAPPGVPPAEPPAASIPAPVAVPIEPPPAPSLAAEAEAQLTLPGPAAPAPIPLTLPMATPIALQRTVTPILLEKEVAPPRPMAVPEGAAWSGEMLRRVRESRGLTIPALADRTRITRHHLENIEQDRFKALPAAVYLRGILMSLARELRLDGQKVARSYLDRMGAGSEAEPKK